MESIDETRESVCVLGEGWRGVFCSLSRSKPQFTHPWKERGRQYITLLSDVTFFNFPSHPEQPFRAVDHASSPAACSAKSSKSAAGDRASAPRRDNVGARRQEGPHRRRRRVSASEDSSLPEDWLRGIRATEIGTGKVELWVLKPRRELLQRKRGLRTHESEQAPQDYPEKGPSGRSRGQAVEAVAGQPPLSDADCAVLLSVLAYQGIPKESKGTEAEATGAQAMERNDVMDFKSLEKELQAALAADEKYKRENAAKLRAVEQRVPSYEEFRGIVLASHLKPLEQKDKMGGKRTISWNCHATQRRTFQDVATEISQEKVLFQPGTSAEFYRDWRRHLRSGLERYEALLQLGGPKLGHLFQVDVGFGLLGELLVVLADHVKPLDRAAVLGILHSLGSTGRFTLNLSLLSQAERESCRSLFQKLRAMGASRATQGALRLEEQGLEERYYGFQGEKELLQELLGLYGVHG